MSQITEETGQSGSAQERAREAAGRAQETAQEVAGQARGRTRQELDRRTTDAGDQLASVAEAIRRSGEQLREEGKDTPARTVERAAEQTERLGAYLREADADRILGDVESFGRRRPWALAAAGATLGFMASRFLKASSTRRYRGDYADVPAQPPAGELEAAPPPTASPRVGLTNAVDEPPSATVPRS